MNCKKKNDMWHWVVIYKSKDGELRICLTGNLALFLSEREMGEEVIYLRPFLDAIDAVAHKHLLEDLSPATVQLLIRKQQDVTRLALNK